MASDDQPANASDKATLDFYAREAVAYTSGGKDTASRWLRDFMRQLPAGGRVLDLGCGGGRDSEALLLHGLDVEPADGSEAMARLAAKRLGRPVKVLRFDELRAVERYDAVWANASLLHVPRAALDDVLAKVFRALKPGGLHFASYKSGCAEGRDTLGRYFNYPDRDSLTQAYARSATWDILSMSDDVGEGYEGQDWPWLAITARRPIT